MAIYTTTRCRHCGHVIRNHERNVPKVQLGEPIRKCSRCGSLYVDDFATEYEFMTDKEKSRFRSTYAIIAHLPFNILAIAFGLFMLFAGISTGGTFLVMGIIMGAIGVYVGVSNIRENAKVADEKLLEQSVYESLRRTENPQYVEYITAIYTRNNIKRTYSPYINRESFMDQYKYFEKRPSYDESIDCINEIRILVEGSSIVQENTK